MKHTEDPTREKILDAAAALTQSDGPHGWSMSQVSARAGFSRGTLYNRFPSRERLLEAVANERGISLSENALAPPRARILDALATLAAADGLEGTTLEAIAARADVATVTIYRLFDDRQGLIEAFARERTPRAHLDALAIDAEGEADDLVVTLEALARGALEHWRTHQEMIAIAAQPAARSNPLFEPFRQQEKQARAMLAELFHHHGLRGDPELLAAQFIGLVHGPVILLEEHGDGDIEQLARDAVALFLNGCTPTRHTQEET